MDCSEEYKVTLCCGNNIFYGVFFSEWSYEQYGCNTPDCKGYVFHDIRLQIGGVIVLKTITLN